MATAPEIKQQQKSQWEAAAPGWDVWARWYQANFHPLTDWLCRAAGVRPGLDVLDVACGIGEPALEAAARARPGGRVVAIDLSPRMLAAARRRAAEKGLGNIEFLEMDAERLDLPDAAFGAVTFACGLMFCPDPLRALAEVRRVLVPGGRFAPGSLDGVIRQAGFSEFAVESRPITLECACLDRYWEIVLAFAPGLQRKLDSLPAADHERLRERVREATLPYTDGERVRLTATPLCAAGRR